MCAYSHTTLAQARAQLAGRLQDNGNVFWLSAELDGLIKESLRTWQVLTAYWRERAVFATVSGTALYSETL